jgi:prepilin-type N-terminal cleavage/methylation domain-containing protein
MRSLRHNLRPTAGGFSIVELLVVVTVIGIAAGFSIPKINRMQNESKVQRAVRALQQDVQQAYAIAGRNRSPVRLTWHSASMQLQLTNIGGTAVYRRTGLGQGSYGFSSSEVAVVPNSLVIFPTGLAGDSLVITITRNSYSKRVRVSKSGMVRLQ